MSPSDSQSPREHDDVITRVVEVCSADDRIVALFLGGSRARGQADEYSDIDLCFIVADDAYPHVIAEREALVRRLGEPLFFEDFGHEHMAFAILADGTDLELHFFRVGDLRAIRSGPHRVLLDGEGILAGVEFPLPEVDPAAQVGSLRQILFWFWHDVAHFTAAIGRDQLWWAAGQLEQLRHYCVNLVRIDQGGAPEGEPYWKLDAEISTEPLGSLRSTFSPMERDEMLRAGLSVVAFFRERAPGVARSHGLAYPTELDRLISGHLDDLAAHPN
jgi:predicted nucleotidyltransferase